MTELASSLSVWAKGDGTPPLASNIYQKFRKIANIMQFHTLGPKFHVDGLNGASGAYGMSVISF